MSTSSSPPPAGRAASTSPMQVDATMDASQSSQASARAAKSPVSTSTPKYEPTDQAVLEYLKSKGMGSAVLELQAKLKQDAADDASGSASSISNKRKKLEGSQDAGSTITNTKDQLEMEEDQARNHRMALTKATGGGFGYDRDAAAPITQWGVPDTDPPPKTDAKDGSATTATSGSSLGLHEARAYLDAFCALQLWVLTLPDDAIGSNLQSSKTTSDVIARAQKIIQQGQDDPTKKVSLSTLMKEISSSPKKEDQAKETEEDERIFQLPPSAKPELLAVTFALLVHTYCELLEVGMETTAHVLRDAFTPLYEPIYGESLKDLHKCYTTEDVIKLNTHNSQHMEALAGLKSILLQIASLQLRQDEVKQTKVTDAKQQQAQKAKIQEYNQTIAILQQRHNEVSKRASQAFDKMYDLPFLRRARAVRWQLTISTTSYGLLAQFLNNSALQSSLLSMSTLLQTKCELHIERRDPLPFTPSIVLDDNRDIRHPDVNEKNLVNWAAPVPPKAMKLEGETKDRPFPEYHLKEEYEDERSARRGKRSVEFNRALLIHGFRRLEALERKREFDAMDKGANKDSSSPKRTSQMDDDSSEHPSTGQTGYRLANPLEPSILLSTLCASDLNSNVSSGNGDRVGAVSSGIATPNTPTNRRATMSSNMWEEAGIGLTCAKLCPPDGRRVAVGCDDSAVRIWDLTKSQPHKAQSHGKLEVGQVLLGHKNGFPVFDLSWNKDGRTLLSAGGDGSVRLWDTMAQGPFGEVLEEPLNATTTTPKKVSDKILTNATAKEALSTATEALNKAKSNPEITVPGLKPETSSYNSGAALAVYRGHAPNTPVWSVEFAPCGYYFASAGGDATARLWTTDRPAPVRVFAGHTSSSVHSVAFHPNCNYVITGGEDRTARLWDIQTGRCVRVLNGCAAGIHQVQIDPSGQYAAGADSVGTVYLWDLATGKKVTDFRPSKPSSMASNSSLSKLGMVHTMAFSACGSALATGGDDQCVRLWDVQQALRVKRAVTEFPKKSFPTRRTLLLDLEFTKRNLLLSVGKYIAAVPLVNQIPE